MLGSRLLQSDRTRLLHGGPLALQKTPGSVGVRQCPQVFVDSHCDSTLLRGVQYSLGVHCGVGAHTCAEHVVPLGTLLYG